MKKNTYYRIRDDNKKKVIKLVEIQNKDESKSNLS